MICSYCKEEIKAGETLVYDHSSTGARHARHCVKNMKDRSEMFKTHRYRITMYDQATCVDCKHVIDRDWYDDQVSDTLCIHKTVALPVDTVNHPSHYNQGGIECIDALASATVNLKGIEAFDTANAIKYLWRWKDKNGVNDLKKAIFYIEHLISLQEDKL